jgi:hypothetical protein
VRLKGGKYVGQPQLHDQELVVPIVTLGSSLVIKAVGSAEREREAHIFKNLLERERFRSVFYIIHKKYIF